jgi:hypothetical protein
MVSCRYRVTVELFGMVANPKLISTEQVEWVARDKMIAASAVG